MTRWRGPLVVSVALLFCSGSAWAAGLWDHLRPKVDASTEKAFKPISSIPAHDGVPASIPSDLFGITIGQSFDEARQALLRYLPGKVPGKTCDAFNNCETPELADEFGQALYTNYKTGITKLYIQDPCPQSGCPSGLRLTTDIAGLTYRSSLSASQAAPDGAEENFRLVFSSPGSGHQLVYMQYFVSYRPEKQPRFEDWISRVREKFGADPIILNPPAVSESVLVYSGGWLPDTSTLVKGGKNAHCAVSFPDNTNALEEKLKGIQSAPCRLVVRMSLQTGASPRHVSRAVLELWDPYRAATNLTNDIASLQDSRSDMERKIDVRAPQL
ncbi:hypothetical protein [Afipia sp. GAS231]|uniref:hypothetical protein n=1 Tax=Afipia sp. GAS231 TaxID=1882747 RepID=UPI00087C464C|nr:hypothetical protein [Afipia sp. GAS231]SDO20703.1 hypothetical protein SAMN05444050_3525 [Afipia sp. GAS231]